MGDSDPDDLQQELLDTGEQKGNLMTTMYDLARGEYAALGIDTEAVMEKLAAKPISVHCWQGNDVLGFDQEGGLSGGIQTTGNYPGRARTFEELTADFEAAMALVPSASTCTPPTPSSPTRTPGSTAMPSSTSTSSPGSRGRRRTATASISTPPSSATP